MIQCHVPYYLFFGRSLRLFILFFTITTTTTTTTSVNMRGMMIPGVESFIVSYPFPTTNHPNQLKRKHQRQHQIVTTTTTTTTTTKASSLFLSTTSNSNSNNNNNKKNKNQFVRYDNDDEYYYNNDDSDDFDHDVYEDFLLYDTRSGYHMKNGNMIVPQEVYRSIDNDDDTDLFSYLTIPTKEDEKNKKGETIIIEEERVVEEKESIRMITRMIPPRMKEFIKQGTISYIYNNNHQQRTKTKTKSSVFFSPVVPYKVLSNMIETEYVTYDVPVLFKIPTTTNVKNTATNNTTISTTTIPSIPTTTINNNNNNNNLATDPSSLLYHHHRRIDVTQSGQLMDEVMTELLSICAMYRIPKEITIQLFHHIQFFDDDSIVSKTKSTKTKTKPTKTTKQSTDVINGGDDEKKESLTTITTAEANLQMEDNVRLNIQQCMDIFQQYGWESVIFPQGLAIERPKQKLYYRYGTKTTYSNNNNNKNNDNKQKEQQELDKEMTDSKTSVLLSSAPFLTNQGQQRRVNVVSKKNRFVTITSISNSLLSMVPYFKEKQIQQRIQRSQYYVSLAGKTIPPQRRTLLSKEEFLIKMDEQLMIPPSPIPIIQPTVVTGTKKTISIMKDLNNNKVDTIVTNENPNVPDKMIVSKPSSSLKSTSRTFEKNGLQQQQQQQLPMILSTMTNTNEQSMVETENNSQKKEKSLFFIKSQLSFLLKKVISSSFLPFPSTLQSNVTTTANYGTGVSTGPLFFFPLNNIRQQQSIIYRVRMIFRLMKRYVKRKYNLFKQFGRIGFIAYCLVNFVYYSIGILWKYHNTGTTDPLLILATTSSPTFSTNTALAAAAGMVGSTTTATGTTTSTTISAMIATLLSFWNSSSPTRFAQKLCFMKFGKVFTYLYALSLLLKIPILITTVSIAPYVNQMIQLLKRQLHINSDNRIMLIFIFGMLVPTWFMIISIPVLHEYRAILHRILLDEKLVQLYGIQTSI